MNTVTLQEKKMQEKKEELYCQIIIHSLQIVLANWDILSMEH